jgi:coenzyme PQQ precursor peptide PqqA
MMGRMRGVPCEVASISPLHREPRGICWSCAAQKRAADGKEDSMAWTTPVLVEICIGLEINGYLPPEF